ncbi:EAL domain-containing protein [Lacticaseibacillus baoqingensis]|uniref:EAL domain-containing protein n=1 Tax=Lacticaseibacillus baoqingensis TaxID=2486013 RepID=A0ABW4E5U0_9LACO|nr:GGDEF and EAL domain-containing protein [Lacticaseibacillus baoqingensis]
MSGGMIGVSYVTTLLFSIFLALGMTSLLYWVDDRAVTPFIVAHRTSIVRVAGLVYLGVLYALQALQYRVDPQMHVFGLHWAFLNLMLISLYVIAVRTGDWVTIIIQELCCAAYLWRYAQPLSAQVLIAYVIWVSVLCSLIVIRHTMQQRRLWDYLGMFALGITGVIGIYVSRPRVFDPWWWVREIMAYLVLGLFVQEYIRLTVAADARTAKLQRVAAYDEMTATAVFARGQTDIATMFDQAQAHHQQLVVAAIDVDHFSAFNQRYGYLAGNIVLLAIVDNLQAVLQKAAINARLYRVGGDEFTLGFLGATAEQAATIVAACLKRVATTNFPVQGGVAHLTLSAGLTITQQEDPSIGTAFARADDNLRNSKQKGGNQSAGSGVKNTGAAPVLTYFAQPIMLIDEAQPWGAELLLRQQDGDHWHLPPRFDIQVEQQIKMIARTLAKSRLTRVTINLTPAQFADTSIANALAGFANAAYGPDALIVEITTVPDLATTRRITAIYRSANIRVFIDDVGSDNSYELVQKVLPYIDGVKFAMQNLRKHEPLARIHERVLFWVDTAKKARIDFILEGVEDQADVDFASRLGIHYCQGYYFGKPALPDALVS